MAAKASSKTKSSLKKATAAHRSILKAQEDLRTEMVSTAGRTAGRTASGRKCQPTEREMYRISKSRHGEDRHKESEAKMEKRKLKLLRAAYQNNPEEFNDEPAELFSDMDKDEENMFSDRYVPTKLSKPRALTFSANKTPPVVSAPQSIVQSRKASAAVALDSDDSKDSDDNESDDNESEDTSKLTDNDIESVRGADFISEHHDEVEDASPQVVGTKRQLQDAVEETKPKTMKALNGSRQRLKASDFDDVTKDLLAISTAIYRCLIVTRNPFPETLIVETMLAKEAWREASNLASLTIQLTPPLVKMMTRRTSHVRGELKTKIRALTASYFGFRTSRSIVAIKQNRDLAESLKDGSCFVFQDWETKRGIYKTELIQSAVNNMWFANRGDEGVIHGRYFDPLPVELLALIITAIECCIDEWITGVKEDIKFSSATYSPIYQVHLNSLQRFDERTSAYKLLGKIGINILDVARFHAGVNSLRAAWQATPVSFTDNIFDEAIREYEAETREAREGSREVTES